MASVSTWSAGSNAATGVAFAAANASTAQTYITSPAHFSRLNTPANAVLLGVCDAFDLVDLTTAGNYPVGTLVDLQASQLSPNECLTKGGLRCLDDIDYLEIEVDASYDVAPTVAMPILEVVKFGAVITAAPTVIGQAGAAPLASALRFTLYARAGELLKDDIIALRITKPIGQLGARSLQIHNVSIRSYRHDPHVF